MDHIYVLALYGTKVQLYKIRFNEDLVKFYEPNNLMWDIETEDLYFDTYPVHYSKSLDAIIILYYNEMYLFEAQGTETLPRFRKLDYYTLEGPKNSFLYEDLWFMHEDEFDEGFAVQVKQINTNISLN